MVVVGRVESNNFSKMSIVMKVCFYVFQVGLYLNAAIHEAAAVNSATDPRFYLSGQSKSPPGKSRLRMTVHPQLRQMFEPEGTAGSFFLPRPNWFFNRPVQRLDNEVDADEEPDITDGFPLDGNAKRSRIGKGKHQMLGISRKRCVWYMWKTFCKYHHFAGP